MAGTTLDIEGVIDPHTLAVDISSRWNSWNNARSEKVKEWKELPDRTEEFLQLFE